ncbi:MAG: glycosyltransferase family 39 protein [Chloroflexota bacterium]|nr:glycosyltransferase family 39 protein [Chloroflexota bacterium]
MSKLLACERCLLPLILLVAVAVRLPGLYGALWFDEIITLVHSVRLPIGQLISSYPSANHHLLYSLLANISISIFGETPFALRLPAVIFGVLAVYATMVFTRLVLSAREALVVGALLALSYHAVWFSQNARGYTGLMFFAMTSFALFYLGWQGKSWVWPWYSVAVALGTYVQLNMIVVPATHATILLADALIARRLWVPAAPGARRAACGALAAAGGLTLLLYAPALPGMMAYYLTLQPGDTGSVDPSLLIRDLVAGLGANFILTPAILALAMWGLIGLMDYGRRDRLVLAMLALPGMWGTLAALAIRSGAAPRFFIYLLPIALILAVRGIETSMGKWRGWVIGGLIALSATSLYFCYRYPKQDFTGALAYVRQHAAPGATVAAAGLAATAYRSYYAPEIAAIYTQEDYRAALHPERETWIVLTFPRDMRARFGGIYDALQSDFELAATFPGTLGDGYLYVYYRPAQREADENSGRISSALSVIASETNRGREGRPPAPPPG